MAGTANASQPPQNPTALQGHTKMGLAHTLTRPGDEAELPGPRLVN